VALLRLFSAALQDRLGSVIGKVARASGGASPSAKPSLNSLPAYHVAPSPLICCGATDVIFALALDYHRPQNSLTILIIVSTTITRNAQT
jgi:hypothetical protein